MNIDKMIEDFRLGNIDIDCRRIVLAQDKEGGERYEGKGYIRQNSDGVLVYKLYVTKHENATPHSTLQNYFSHISKIHPNETFFILEAEAKDGSKLRASRFFPHVYWDMRAGEPEFVSGRLQALTAEPALPQHDHCLELHFFEEHPVPLIEGSEVEECDGKHYVVDSAEFDACGSHFKVHVREGSGRSVVEASADKPFPPDFHWRIQEALQFITGRTATFRALVTCEPGAQQLELISSARLSQRPHFCPPIKHVSMAYRNHAWELFAAYLTYVVESSPATQWNPLAYHLYNAREASANSIDAWAMGVSVALEAVASLVALPDDREKRAEAMRAGQLVKQFVAAEPALKDVKDRLNGLLGMLEQPPGPRATLKWLASQGKVEKAYIERWTDLRNAHVHPKLADFERPDEATYQTQLDRIHGVQVLLCQVIYYLIGYSGPYTDYAAESYPDKLYPLTVAQSAGVG